nr:hypothetical protein [Tanacetum cinerariifolium]
MELFTKLQQRVFDLETTKTTQALEINNLKRRVKKLERRKRSRTHRLKRLYKVGLSARVESFEDEDMFGVNDLDGEEVIVESFDVAEQAKEVVDDITLAKALMEIKSAKPKADKVVIQELEQELAFKLQAEEEEEERLDREKVQQIEEVDVAWDDIKAKIDADYQLARRLQEKEQDALTDEEKARLFMELLQKRIKFFATKSVKDKGKCKMVELEPMKKLSNKDQLMLNEELAFKLQAEEEEEEERLDREKVQQIEEVDVAWDDIKAKINADYQLARRLQEKEQDALSDEEKARLAFKRVNTFINYKTELVEGSSKRAGEELTQERSKKQKVDDDKETADLKKLMEIIPNEEEVTINAILLVVKSLKIVDWKIHNERKKIYYQIIRAGGNSKIEDVETLWKLIKAKHGSTRPEEGYERVLWGDLKVMFEPHVEDEVWRLQHRYSVVSWKLFNSCGVHCLSLQSRYIYMLVEKKYHITPTINTDMLNKKLHVDYYDEMTYQLLKLVTKQLKK